MERAVTSGLILRIRPQSTLPDPISTNSSAPSAIICSTCADHITGLDQLLLEQTPDIRRIAAGPGADIAIDRHIRIGQWGIRKGLRQFQARRRHQGRMKRAADRKR